jgi:hypothetical protein
LGLVLVLVLMLCLEMVLVLVLVLVLKRGSIVRVVWVKDWDLHGLLVARRHGRWWMRTMKRGMIDSSTPAEPVGAACGCGCGRCRDALPVLQADADDADDADTDDVADADGDERGPCFWLSRRCSVQCPVSSDG